MRPRPILMWPSGRQKTACIRLLFPTQNNLKHMIQNAPVQIEGTD